jgi:hypothetical protein
VHVGLEDRIGASQRQQGLEWGTLAVTLVPAQRDLVATKRWLLTPA